MAKLTAPLFSFGARGKLANALVYFPWKGLDVVRSYVIPANPQTAAQTTQRGHFEDAVDAWHAAPYTALDVGAWNRLAGIADKIMSGFNRMIREYVLEAIAGNTWERLRNVTTAAIDDTSFEVDCQKVGGGTTPYVHYGTRKTHFPDSQILVDISGAHWSTDITGLTADTLYYFYVSVGTRASDWARTGIYSQRTTA